MPYEEINDSVLNTLLQNGKAQQSSEVCNGYIARWL
jgi:hypothetical protein